MNIFDPKNNFEFRDYLRILKKRKWYFFIPIILVLPFGLYKIASNEPVYSSTCKIKVEPSSYQLLPQSLKHSLPKVSLPPTAFGVRRQVLDEKYLNEVVKILELHKDKRFRQKALEMQNAFPEKDFEEIVWISVVKTVRRSLRVTPLSRDVLQIAAKADTPDLAYALVKTLTEVYLADAQQRAMNSLQEALSFNDDQIGLFKQRLEKAEEKLEAFKRQMITSDLATENISKNDLSRIHKEIGTIEIAIKGKQDYLENLEQQVDENKVQVTFAIPEVQNLLPKIDNKVTEMADLMRTFPSRSPEVTSVNRKINDIREQIRDAFKRHVRQQYPGMSTAAFNLYLERAVTHLDLDILKRKKTALESLVDNFRTERSQDPSREMMLQKLQSEVEVNRRIYNMFSQQNQGVEIEQLMTLDDASDRLKVVEPPKVSNEPVNAGSRMILMVTLVLGFGMGGGAVYLREYLDSSVCTVNEVERIFGIPVIAVIPNLGQELENVRGTAPRKWVVIGVVGGVAVLLIGAAIFFYFEFGNLL